jgi:hypothetical protein
MLSLLQWACATQDAVSGGGDQLLSFEAISAEITVTYEEAAEAADLSQTVALNIEK